MLEVRMVEALNLNDFLETHVQYVKAEMIWKMREHKSNNHKDQPFKMLHFLFSWNGGCFLWFYHWKYNIKITQYPDSKLKPIIENPSFEQQLVQKKIDSMHYKNNRWGKWSYCLIINVHDCQKWSYVIGLSWNLPKTSMKSAQKIHEISKNIPETIQNIPQNLSGMTWEQLANPRVPNEVPNSLGMFPKGPKDPGTRGHKVRGVFWGEQVPMQHSS